MFNEKIDTLRAMMSAYESQINRAELESANKARAHAEECANEIAELFALGFYGSAEKAFIINA